MVDLTCRGKKQGEGPAGYNFGNYSVRGEKGKKNVKKVYSIQKTQGEETTPTIWESQKEREKDGAYS